MGLGRNTFLPHTHQKAGVLFGIKRKNFIKKLSSEKILFLISEKEGKDSKGIVIPQKGSKPGEPVWIRADHDLGELVDHFKEFIKNEQIGWGPP